MPGLVDFHVHVNDPGRTEREGFASATRAAAAGGVTTIVDMPLNSIPPAVDTAALAVKRTTAADQSYIDVGFWGGAVPGNVAELRPLHDAGVFGFKCFLPHSGVEEFPPLHAAEVGELRRTAHPARRGRARHRHRPASTRHALRRLPVLAATPDGGPGHRAGDRAGAADRVPGAHPAPVQRRRAADDRRGPGRACSAQRGHLSALALLRHRGYPDGAILFKCCPPIREGANRDELSRRLAEGLIDTIVSDHSPSTVDLKCLDTGDFDAALPWGLLEPRLSNASSARSTARCWNSSRSSLSMTRGLAFTVGV